MIAVVRSYRVGSTAVVSAMCDAIGLSETIDECVNWDEKQCRLSPGTRVKAIIINILAGRSPLYLVHEFYETMDLPALFGDGVKASDFEDYSLARALDKVSEAEPKKVFSSVTLKAHSLENVGLSRLHGDTSSWTFSGIFEDDEDEELPPPLKITKGYNKDHKPGSKQLLYGLVVSEEKIPLIGDVIDGNTSDKAWNSRVLDELSTLMTEDQLRSLTYVADSAFVTPENLKKAKSLKFISRLPGTYALETSLKEKAWELGNWQNVGVIAGTVKKDSAVYRYQEFTETLYDQEYRFVVVHSSKLDAKKLKTLKKIIEKQQQELEKAAKKLASNTYACRPDAEAALAAAQKEQRNAFFTLEGQIIELEQLVKRPGRGRPKKDQAPEYETVYQVDGKVSTLDQAAFQHEKERLSCFVLITNILDTSKDGGSILSEYKSQSSVELQFKAIKDPEFVGSMYLKRPDRIQALAYVVLMAVLVKNLIERRVRRAMKMESEPLIMPGKKKSWEPTGDKILDLFSGIDVVMTGPGKREFSMGRRFPDRLFRLVGFSPDVYLKVSR